MHGKTVNLVILVRIIFQQGLLPLLWASVMNNKHCGCLLNPSDTQYISPDPQLALQECHPLWAGSSCSSHDPSVPRPRSRCDRTGDCPMRSLNSSPPQRRVHRTQTCHKNSEMRRYLQTPSDNHEKCGCPHSERKVKSKQLIYIQMYSLCKTKVFGAMWNIRNWQEN